MHAGASSWDYELQTEEEGEEEAPGCPVPAAVLALDVHAHGEHDGERGGGRTSSRLRRMRRKRSGRTRTPCPRRARSTWWSGGCTVVPGRRRMRMRTRIAPRRSRFGFRRTRAAMPSRRRRRKSTRRRRRVWTKMRARLLMITTPRRGVVLTRDWYQRATWARSRTRKSRTRLRCPSPRPSLPRRGGSFRARVGKQTQTRRETGMRTATATTRACSKKSAFSSL
ncbi:hypothetical protein DFH09DRAFT_82947 [Mycena vulgaris]|nr:hypothetical protein DFH09DRAFT_82947 [Mycena vulgaris]